MENILQKIVAKKREIVEAAKASVPLADVVRSIRPGSFTLSGAFRATDWGLIAECKLQSPSKGRFGHSWSVTELAKIFAENGATALSVHTDPHFLGKNSDLTDVKKITTLPVMRKDFIIDDYQIYESRMLGADAVLLIARILPPEKLKRFLHIAWELGMDALVETHDADDLAAALSTPAELIGINNRNLADFSTSIENTIALLPSVPKSRMVISESGVSSPADARRLFDAGCRGVLVGEGLVTAPDVAVMTAELESIT